MPSNYIRNEGDQQGEKASMYGSHHVRINGALMSIGGEKRV
jgi:hypothetical protein